MWTLFVNPMQKVFGWDRSAIQVAFTIFMVAETWRVPLHGYLVDRFGPKLIVLLAGLFCGAAWVMNAYLTSLPMLYLAQAIGGVGGGAIYGAAVGNALKWFPDRRGLAAGVTAAGFGMGSALTVIPISLIIANQGFQSAFLFFGVLQGVAICLCALSLKAPPGADAAKPLAIVVAGAARRQYSPQQMAKTPAFWLMYAMFAMMAAGGLMATAQLGPIAKDFGVADAPVSFIGTTLPALTFALSSDRVLNGVTRPFFGWISDKIGREPTMFIAFALEGLAILALSKFGQALGLFVLLTGFVFFAWDEIYSLFSGYLHRHLRLEIRRRQCRPALHRQGDRGAAGAVLQPADRGHRQLASGVLVRRRDEHRHRVAGDPRAAAIAVPDDVMGLIAGCGTIGMTA